MALISTVWKCPVCGYLGYTPQGSPQADEASEWSVPDVAGDLFGLRCGHCGQNARGKVVKLFDNGHLPEHPALPRGKLEILTQGPDWRTPDGRIWGNTGYKTDHPDYLKWVCRAWRKQLSGVKPNGRPFNTYRGNYSSRTFVVQKDGDVNWL